MPQTGFIIIVGPAGSGKTTLTGELASFMENFGVSVATINFDPAVESLNYEPDIDVRDYVSVDEFTSKGLGPNGALIAAVDSLINHVSKIRERVEELKVNYIIVDTPGQLELFAFRAGGPVVLEALTHDYPTVVVFLMDSVFFEAPHGIVSVLTLATSVAMRFRKPQVNVVSKADLLVDEVLEEVIPRLGEEGFLESLVAKADNLDEFTRDLAIRISQALYESGFIGEVIPVSVKDPNSLAALYSKIQQILAGGDDYGIYDVVGD